MIAILCCTVEEGSVRYHLPLLTETYSNPMFLTNSRISSDAEAIISVGFRVACPRCWNIYRLCSFVSVPSLQNLISFAPSFGGDSLERTEQWAGLWGSLKLSHVLFTIWLEVDKFLHFISYFLNRRVQAQLNALPMSLPLVFVCVGTYISNTTKAYFYVTYLVITLTSNDLKQL